MLRQSEPIRLHMRFGRLRFGFLRRTLRQRRPCNDTGNLSRVFSGGRRRRRTRRFREGDVDRCHRRFRLPQRVHDWRGNGWRGNGWHGVGRRGRRRRSRCGRGCRRSRRFGRFHAEQIGERPPVIRSRGFGHSMFTSRKGRVRKIRRSQGRKYSDWNRQCEVIAVARLTAGLSPTRHSHAENAKCDLNEH